MPIEEIVQGLKSKIGQETHVSSWLTITQERIDRFAEATGDFQWIHTDPERARKESPYGTPIAHGFLTLSLIPSLTGSVEASKKEFPEMKLAVNYGLNRVRFPNPVKVGSQIRARTELIHVEEVSGGVQMVKKITVEIEGEAKPACVAETVTRLYF